MWTGKKHKHVILHRNNRLLSYNLLADISSSMRMTFSWQLHRLLRNSVCTMIWHYIQIWQWNTDITSKQIKVCQLWRNYQSPKLMYEIKPYRIPCLLLHDNVTATCKILETMYIHLAKSDDIKYKTTPSTKIYTVKQTRDIFLYKFTNS